MPQATQFTGFGPLLFNMGLADTRAAKVYDAYDERFTKLLEAGDAVGAFRSFDEMLNGDYYGVGQYTCTLSCFLSPVLHTCPVRH